MSVALRSDGMGELKIFATYVSHTKTPVEPETLSVLLNIQTFSKRKAEVRRDLELGLRDRVERY